MSSVPDLQQSISHFQNLPRSEREKLRCVMGHGTYGLHDHLPGSTEYITIFRHPVSRVISNYYYVRRSPEHRVYEEANEMSLREYATSGVNTALDNQMTRNVTGTTGGGDEKTLQKAKDILDKRFGVVGLVKRFDESLLLMKERYGWEDIAYRKRNVTSDRPRKEDLLEHTIQEIEERNQLDIELYEYGQNRLSRKLERTDLNRKLRSLRRKCWIRSKKIQLKNKVKQGLSSLGLR